MDKLGRLENISHYTPPSSPRQTNSLQADTGIRGDGMWGEISLKFGEGLLELEIYMSRLYGELIKFRGINKVFQVAVYKKSYAFHALIKTINQIKSSHITWLLWAGYWGYALTDFTLSGSASSHGGLFQPMPLPWVMLFPCACQF